MPLALPWAWKVPVTVSVPSVPWPPGAGILSLTVKVPWPVILAVPLLGLPTPPQPPPHLNGVETERPVSFCRWPTP